MYRTHQWLMQPQSRLLERRTIRRRPRVTAFGYWREGPADDRDFTRHGTGWHRLLAP